MSKETPRQSAARQFGELAALLRCTVETVAHNRAKAHEKLDVLLDRLHRMSKTGPDTGVTVVTIKLRKD